MDEQSTLSEFLENLELGNISFYKTVYPILPIKQISYTRVAPIIYEEDSTTFRMEICPGDTISQCKALYSKDRIKSIKDLEKSGWRIATNLHLSSTFKNVIWFSYQHDWIEYLSYWSDEYKRGNIRQYKRSEWESLITKLTASGNISNQEKKEFELLVGQKNFSRMNLCASLRIWFNIRFDDLHSNQTKVEEQTRNMLNAFEKALI